VTGTFPTPLLARRERLWPVLLVSFGCHAAVLGFAALHRPAPIIDLEKPMQARLVRLGEKRPDWFLPRKEQAPEAAPAPAIALPGPAAKAAPARPSTAATARPDPLASALARVKREQALGEPTWGDPRGDAFGEASEASEGDRYLALVTRALQASYRLPSTISERDRALLKASVVLFIEPDGRISSWRFELKSGNAAFDEALERTVRRTRLPPPPSELRQHYRSDGILVRFHI
jgi:colicin import membrane protein/protein TonB